MKNPPYIPYELVGTRSERFAAAVVRCYDLFIERRTRGSRLLYDAVNEMFAYLLTDDYYRGRKC